LSSAWTDGGELSNNIFVEQLWRSGKYVDVYLKGYASMGELLVGLAQYFAFYNGERPHQSLGQTTPDVVYRTAIGGGAMIVDKFGGAVGETPVERSGTGVSPTPEAKSKATAKTEARQNRGSAVQLLLKSKMCSLNSVYFCLDSGIHFILFRSIDHNFLWFPVSDRRYTLTICSIARTTDEKSSS